MKQNADKFLKAHGVYTGMGLYEISVKNLEDFAKLVERATLERAALELEQYGGIQDTSGMEMAKEIRALKDSYE